MNRTWLLLDTNYLACRAFFSTGSLSWEEKATGVTYGVLRDVTTLVKEHDTMDLVFCFDYGRGLREQAVPTYKESRRKKKEEMVFEEKKAWESLQDQLNQLRTTILPDLGFHNVYFQEGYEADDMIAAFVKTVVQKDETAIVVSRDSDLLQLLRKNVYVWDPTAKEMMSKKVFKKKYG
jgi:DNA polymerase-1